jgi:hypothetical protein
MSKTADRLAALVATVEWLGTYSGDTLTLAEGATVTDGVPADMVAAYALAVEQLTAYQAMLAKTELTSAYRAAIRARFAEEGITPAPGQVNRLAAKLVAADVAA